MNERDLKLYSYLKGKGGGGGGGAKMPQIIDFQEDIDGNDQSWTSKNFSLSAGDTLIVAVMHRTDISYSQDLSLVITNTNMSSQRITILSYTATAAETKSVNIVPAQRMRMDYYVWHMRNVSVSGNSNLSKGQKYSGTATFTNEYRPILIMFGCYTPGAGHWTQPNNQEGQLIFMPDRQYSTYAIDFNTAYSSSISFTSSGDQWSTVGIYLTEAPQP